MIDDNVPVLIDDSVPVFDLLKTVFESIVGQYFLPLLCEPAISTFVQG
jgi:hypothetical protein